MSNRVPEGYKEIKNIDTVFYSDTEIVILGSPDDEDEIHNCDQMGCGTLDHVLLRIATTYVTWGFDKEQHYEQSNDNRKSDT